MSPRRWAGFTPWEISSDWLPYASTLPCRNRYHFLQIQSHGIGEQIKIRVGPWLICIKAIHISPSQEVLMKNVPDCSCHIQYELMWHTARSCDDTLQGHVMSSMSSCDTLWLPDSVSHDLIGDIVCDTSCCNDGWLLTSFKASILSACSANCTWWVTRTTRRSASSPLIHLQEIYTHTIIPYHTMLYIQCYSRSYPLGCSFCRQKGKDLETATWRTDALYLSYG